MKMINFFTISCCIFISTTLHAEPTVALGKKLSEAELAQLKGSNITIDGQSLKVITKPNIPNKRSRTPQASQKTFIANKSGLVGVSENLVLISEIPTDQVRSSAKHILNTATSVKYYDNLKISSLQFKTFNQAVNAYNQLIKLFPNAAITIPIKYSEPSLR